MIVERTSETSVVSGGVGRHGEREHYRAQLAGRQAAAARAQPKVRKLDADPVLHKVIASKLSRVRRGSAQGRLRHDKQAWHVSGEATYH